MTTRQNQPGSGGRGSGPRSVSAYPPPSYPGPTPRPSKAYNAELKTEGAAPLVARVQEQIEAGKTGVEELKETVSSSFASGLEAAKAAVSDATEKVEEVAHDAQETVTKAAHSMVATIKANPIPAAMVGLGGIGLAMLFTGGKHESEARTPASRPTPKATTAAGRASDQVSGQARSAVRRAKRSIGKMSDAAGRTFQRTSKSAQAQVQRVGQAIEENPIKVSAGALLVGVGVGLALPRSFKENQWLGTARDSIVAKGHALAHQALDKVQAARQLVTGSEPAGEARV